MSANNTGKRPMTSHAKPPVPGSSGAGPAKVSRTKRPEMSPYFPPPASVAPAPLPKPVQPPRQVALARPIPPEIPTPVYHSKTLKRVSDDDADASSPSSAPQSALAALSPPLPPPLIAVPKASFADRALHYFTRLGHLDFSTLPLPPRVTIVNPYSDLEVLRVMGEFLREYCSSSEDKPRVFLFGINPGRFGAGITGVPFTDPTALRTKLKIESSLKSGRREASGEFIWQVIDSLGARNFFSRYWITSLFPLCLLKDGLNYNFYDDTATFSALRPFIVRHLEEQRCNLGAATSVAICIGTGQNQRALQELNNFYRLFDTLLCVEHPRFIVQYRRATMHAYLDKYRDTLEKATEIASKEKHSK